MKKRAAMIDKVHLTPVAGLFDMKLMHDSVHDWGEQYAHDADEDQTTKQRVAGGEEFCARSFDRINRSHAAENHRGFEQRVDPIELSQPMISDDADQKNDADHADREGGSVQHAPGKN